MVSEVEVSPSLFYFFYKIPANEFKAKRERQEDSITADLSGTTSVTLPASPE
jgi:hypothetical protein